MHRHWHHLYHYLSPVGRFLSLHRPISVHSYRSSGHPTSRQRQRLQRLFSAAAFLAALLYLPQLSYRQRLSRLQLFCLLLLFPLRLSLSAAAFSAAAAFAAAAFSVSASQLSRLLFASLASAFGFLRVRSAAFLAACASAISSHQQRFYAASLLLFSGRQRRLFLWHLPFVLPWASVLAFADPAAFSPQLLPACFVVLGFFAASSASVSAVPPVRALSCAANFFFSCFSRSLLCGLLFAKFFQFACCACVIFHAALQPVWRLPAVVVACRTVAQRRRDRP